MGERQDLITQEDQPAPGKEVLLCEGEKKKKQKNSPLPQRKKKIPGRKKGTKEAQAEKRGGGAIIIKPKKKEGERLHARGESQVERKSVGGGREAPAHTRLGKKEGYSNGGEGVSGQWGKNPELKRGVVLIWKKQSS